MRTNLLVRWLLRTSTPASAAAFGVVAITGVLMFLHISQQRVEDLHEWAGLCMVAAAGLHMARHWKALAAYRHRGRTLYVSLLTAALGAGLFLAASLAGVKRGGLDALRVCVEGASLATLAPVLGDTPAGLTARLHAAGFSQASEQSSPAQIAAASHHDSREVLEALMAEPAREGGH